MCGQAICHGRLLQMNTIGTGAHPGKKTTGVKVFRSSSLHHPLATPSGSVSAGVNRSLPRSHMMLWVSGFTTHRTHPATAIDKLPGSPWHTYFKLRLVMFKSTQMNAAGEAHRRHLQAHTWQLLPNRMPQGRYSQ